jgi:hypothetical protein
MTLASYRPDVDTPKGDLTLTNTAIKKPLTDAAIKPLKPRTVRYSVSDGRVCGWRPSQLAVLAVPLSLEGRG